MSDELDSMRYIGSEDFPDKIPPRKDTRKGGKDMKMSKDQTTPAPVKAKYAKTKGEHTKDIVIAVLISGIIAFVSGMYFQGRQQAAIETAVKGAQTVAPVKNPEVKK